MNILVYLLSPSPVKGTERKTPLKLSMFIQSCSLILTASSDDIEVSALTLDNIAVTFCPAVPALAQSHVRYIAGNAWF